MFLLQPIKQLGFVDVVLFVLVKHTRVLFRQRCKLALQKLLLVVNVDSYNVVPHV